MNVNVCAVSGSGSTCVGCRSARPRTPGRRRSRSAHPAPRSPTPGRSPAHIAARVRPAGTRPLPLGPCRQILGDQSFHRSAAIHVVAIRHPRAGGRNICHDAVHQRRGQPCLLQVRRGGAVVGDRSAVAHHPRCLMVGGVPGENLGNGQLRPSFAAHDPRSPARCQQLGPRSASLSGGFGAACAAAVRPPRMRLFVSCWSRPVHHAPANRSTRDIIQTPARHRHPQERGS
jgi:hypothetical protein